MFKLAFLILLSTAPLVIQARTAGELETPPDRVCEHALVRQAPHTESMLTDTPQRRVSLKHGRGAKMLGVESLTKTGASMMGGPAAAFAVPYMETGVTKAAQFGRQLVARHGTESEHIEFDTLDGPTAGLTLNPGNVEILVPLNRYIASAQESADDIRPVLLKLDVSVKDQVRIMTARHIEVMREKKGRFDVKPAVARVEDKVDETVVPTSFERLPGNVYRIVNREPLAPGEFALVFRKKAEAGQYTANVELATTSKDHQAPGSSISRLSDLMNPANRSNGLVATATDFIAFDFRVLP